jgi:hypothetical protein
LDCRALRQLRVYNIPQRTQRPRSRCRSAAGHFQRGLFKFYPNENPDLLKAEPSENLYTVSAQDTSQPLSHQCVS